jgi:biotin operon repressor
MQRGYIKIWRKMEDSGLLQMHSTFALFMHMLMKAAYKPVRIGMVDLKRGQLVSGRFKLAEAIGISDRQIRTCIDKLHKLQIVTSESTSHYTIYTIVNYDEYQDSDTSSDQPNDQQPTSWRPTTDQQPTTIQEANTLSIKEVKKETKPSAAFALPDWINKNHWDLWVASRKKMTPEQKQMQVDKLLKWKNDGLNFSGALEDAAANGTQGLFLPKHNGSVYKTPDQRRSENMDRSIDIFLGNSSGEVIDV